MCREPQVYLTNFDFLTRKIPSYQKTDYLHMISQRRMSDRNNWIPRDYVSKTILDKFLALFLETFILCSSECFLPN